ncbi:DUF1127 domain-containing protein [Rhodobacteraceae bacterium]|nr:DUF1127 domain-containing protein [Paracoccaceae bacterium]
MNEVTVSPTGQTGRLTEFFRGLARRHGQYRVYRQTLSELQNLSSRELADLGLHRSVLRSVAYQAAYDV